MKKLAFALAMLIALTGCLFALASCGEEEESSAPAESSAAASSEEAPAASSEEAPAASSEEAPAESSEEAPAEPSEEAPAEPSEDSAPVLGDSVLFWLTHYNNGEVEGAGSVFTETDAGGAWWNHVSFKPVGDAENLFEVVEVSIGSNGAGTALAVPEGGFVYAVNIGNDWPTLCAGLTGDGSSGQWYDDEKHLAMPNYVTIQVTEAFAWAGALTPGQQYMFEGLDLENQVVPTTTPDLNWYEDGYICTAYAAAVN